MNKSISYIKLQEIPNEIILDVALEIYLSNPNYFIMSSGKPATKEDLIRDISIYPDVIEISKKNTRLYLQNELPIGIVDFILGFPNSDTVYIGLLIVDSKYKLKGFGSQIYKDLETEFKELDYSRVRIGVMIENTEGLNFWNKMGFTIQKTTSTSISENISVDVYIMEKAI